MLVFLFATTFVFCWLLYFRERLRINVVTALSLSVLSVLIGYISLILFARMESIGSSGNGANYSLFGAVFIMPITFWIGAKVAKRDITSVFDIFTIPMIVALLFARANCLLTGCCAGLPISGTNGLHWPTRETEIIFYLIFIGHFAPKVLKKKTSGELYPWYMLTYGILRFILETLRVSSTNTIFHLSHLWAVVSFCIGMTLVLELNETKRRK